ncbi:MAG: pyruvate dehydrogenase complex dihydrolipoamide acetyltransferase [Robiginitomaculum sp.]|nr:MAG: pyruvate dehydrogenase complex dihydrolipoamide acetyltransferase [Robiginitomaculum sp.]PHQ66522.1 MAG: pyruvate dehydrogenase complex dihydrolipoamide acetyltransferase [Robiginitomaculum sp.]
MPIEILMPALSPTMEEGTLTKWLVAEGAEISSGDVLAEIETDKATMEIEAVEEGVLVKILVAEGSVGVKVNAPIAVLLEDGEDASVMDGYVAGANAPVAATPEPSLVPLTPSKDGAQEQQAPSPAALDPVLQRDERIVGERIKASPLAKRMAREKGLDLAAITGTGPKGRIIKVDIETAGTAPIAAPTASATTASATTTELGPLRGGGADYLEKLGVPVGSYDLEPLDGMRRIIAKRLTESARDIPHFPLNIDCEIDALLAIRKELNYQAPDGVKISVNDMLIRACAIALKQVPEANASFTPDGIAYHHHADIAVAVAIDGGLITPIVREAENKGLTIISTEMKDLASRARDRKLKPQEFQGGTFSISNMGMMGIKSFSSIINPPQGMIMSVGAGALRPIVRDGELAVATVMTVTVTCDHRVVDGAIGAQWLAVFKRLIEKPVTMML